MPALKELNNTNFADTIEALTVVQSSICILDRKVQGYRINIVGPNFYEYHSFLSIVHEKLEHCFYEFGERLRMLGALSSYSVQQMLDASVIADATTPLTKYDDMVASMNADFVSLSNLARPILTMSAPLADAGTIALVTSFCFNVADHFAWETRVMMQQ